MMNLILNLLLLTAAAVSPLGPETTADAYYNRVGDADEAIRRGHWAEAAEALTDAMHLDPANPGNVMLLSNLGIMQFNMGQDSLALATLDSAHAMAPRSVTILQNRARVYTALNDLDAAWADYNTVVALDSMAHVARFYRAIIELGRNNIVTATLDSEFLKAHAPQLTETDILAGLLANATADYPAAIAAFTRVLKAAPEPEYYAERALANLMTDRLGEAADDIARGLEADPAYGRLYLYRAMLNKARFRPDDAAADVDRAISLGIPAARARALLQ